MAPAGAASTPAATPAARTAAPADTSRVVRRRAIRVFPFVTSPLWTESWRIRTERIRSELRTSGTVPEASGHIRPARAGRGGRGHLRPDGRMAFRDRAPERHQDLSRQRPAGPGRG